MTHESDTYTWAKEQAALLRAGRLEALDVANLIEELDAMGARERRELVNRLVVLLVHLLKWQHQPDRRGRFACSGWILPSYWRIRPGCAPCWRRASRGRIARRACWRPTRPG